MGPRAFQRRQDRTRNCSPSVRLWMLPPQSPATLKSENDLKARRQTVKAYSQANSSSIACCRESNHAVWHRCATHLSRGRAAQIYLPSVHRYHMQQLRWFVPIEKCDCCFDNQVRIDYWPEARVGLLSPEEASIVGDRMGIGAKTLVTGPTRSVKEIMQPLDQAERSAPF